MSFNTDKFLNTRWEPRIFDVSVPGLKEFFDDGEDPIWRVRGLSGAELGQANLLASGYRKTLEKFQGLFSRISSGGNVSSKDIKEIESELKVKNDDITYDTALNLEYFVIGSVDHQGNYDLAKKILEARFNDFASIVGKIKELTGMGHIPGESKPSGKTVK